MLGVSPRRENRPHCTCSESVPDEDQTRSTRKPWAEKREILGGAGGEAGDGPDGAAGGGETCGDACAEWLKRAGGRADGWASLRRLVDESGDQFLLLAAQLVGEAVARYAEASEAAREVGAHLLPLRCLSSPRSCQAATSDAALHTSLQAVRACFAAAAERWPSLAEEALTPQEWRRCVGASRANSIGVAVPSPLVLYMAEAEALPAESGERRLLARSVWPVLQRVQVAAALGGGEGGGEGGSEGEGEGEGESEGESEGSGGSEGESSSEEEEEEEEEEVFFSWGLDAARGGGRRGGKPVSSRCFPPHTGSAVFPLVSLMNHSCEPNVQVIYLESNAAVAIALRGIADGEELCIQYVSAEAPLEERRRELRRRYGFECACALCTSQARGRVGKRGRDLHSI